MIQSILGRTSKKGMANISFFGSHLPKDVPSQSPRRRTASGGVWAEDSLKQACKWRTLWDGNAAAVFPRNLASTAQTSTRFPFF